MTFHDLKDIKTHPPAGDRGDELEIFEGAMLEIVLHETRKREGDYSASHFAVANFLVHTCSFSDGLSPAEYLDALEKEVGAEVISEAARQFDSAEVMANLVELPARERHAIARGVIDEILARQHDTEAFRQTAGHVATRQQILPPQPAEPELALAA